MTDVERSRRIVALAASEESSAQEWLRRDERGTWELEAKRLWEKLEPRRIELGMSESDAESQLAVYVRSLALKALLADAKKREAR
jgi:hypothetical protein